MKRFFFPIALIIGFTCLNAQTNDSTKIVIAAEALNMNIVYVGVPNPFNIAVSGIPANKIKIITDNGIVTGENGHFFIRPDRLGHCIITAISDDKIIGTRDFRVHTINDPIHVTIAGKTGGEISKEELINAGGLKAYFFPSDFDLSVRVVAFRIISVKDGYVKDIKKTGDALNNDMKELIKSLESGSPVFFEGIKVLSSDGITRDYDPLSFKIK